jgi:hypothetical protein
MSLEKTKAIPYPSETYPTLPYPTLPYPTLPHPTYPILVCSLKPKQAGVYFPVIFWNQK